MVCTQLCDQFFWYILKSDLFFIVLINDAGLELLGRYASIRAIETKSPVDDQQWLTYWVLYSMITLFELTFAKLIEW